MRSRIDTEREPAGHREADLDERTAEGLGRLSPRRGGGPSPHDRDLRCGQVSASTSPSTYSTVGGSGIADSAGG